MFKIKKGRGKFEVALYSVYNKLLWSAGGFSSKQAAIKNIRATMDALNILTTYYQDESVLNPAIYRISIAAADRSYITITKTNKKLWK